MSKDHYEQISFENLLEQPRPHVPTGTHPIEEQSYIIPTNEVLRMFQAISKWIKYRSPGGIIYGRPRLGKTRAIEYLLRILPNEFGNDLPVFHIRTLHTKLANEGVFFETLLKDVGHGVPFSGKPSIKRDRLAKFLAEKGDTSRHKRIVMFIDEAQCLHELNYGWLMDIYNELDQNRIAMTVILVGQEELLHRRTLFMETKRHQIIGRFMVHEHRFTGIKTKDDLSICLSGFDQLAEFPKGSGWSYTRFFFPEAYAVGNRLQDCSEELFDVFSSLRQQAKIRGTFEIPMQYLITTIEYALLEFGANGRNIGWVTKALWEEAIYASGYIHAELRIPAVEFDESL
ncbi:ATP-binding protein [Brevibacillus sp. Leaf182]|uniref:ATP-binding protein n=1 Tax=Brevibacillus sp. Leaf182 TaxID=1736290 RepID=UPI000AF86405|nr:ATP-binding protein [Brevibacillus sp. Leaf182]